MRSFLFSILCFFLFFGCGRKEASRHLIIGVKIYDHDGKLEDLFVQLTSAGINTLFVSPQLARKPGFKTLASDYEMPVYLIIPTFYNPEALEKDNSLYAITSDGRKAVDDWVEFICPNQKEYRNKHLNDLQSLVRELSPEGISLDFIRYFVYWEKVFPDQAIRHLPQTCFDDTCLAVFSEKYNIQFPEEVDSRVEKANYILSDHLDTWTRFKVHVITSYVNEIIGSLHEVDSTLKINLHFVPWRDTDFDGAIRKIAGQDAGELGPLVNFISPMCYSHMVKQPPEWVHQVVTNLNNQAAGQILPSIQVGQAYRQQPFSSESFRIALKAAIEPPSNGVIFWSWEALEKDPAKLEIVSDEIMNK
jgi:hypothetical protein